MLFWLYEWLENAGVALGDFLVVSRIVLGAKRSADEFGMGFLKCGRSTSAGLMQRAYAPFVAVANPLSHQNDDSAHIIARLRVPR